MSYKCSICNKRSTRGNIRSHSNKATRKIFKPNLQNIKIILNGKRMHRYVCTSCIKAKRVTKVI
ncbi:MAG: 50S ribosomal protein L28 [Endomicrobium sp.]|jgi:large subunit ribosomal protein L28|nr:50S ribosomal protein L28 [Endomicrobium sp.]